MNAIPSDSTLQTLWRQVVRQEWGGECALLGHDVCAGNLECHHVKKRRIPHLRHCPTNGILICQAHHAKAETGYWRRLIEATIGPDKMEWLDMMEQKLFPEFLAELKITRKEYFWNQRDYLRKLLEAYDG